MFEKISFYLYIYNYISGIFVLLVDLHISYFKQKKKVLPQTNRKLLNNASLYTVKQVQYITSRTKQNNKDKSRKGK